MMQSIRLLWQDLVSTYLRMEKHRGMICLLYTSCREGTKRMLELLTDITEGRGTMEHIELLETLAETVSATALCGLGKTCLLYTSRCV